MAAILVAAYPVGSEIDKEYYINKHIPKAQKHYEGMTNWSVCDGLALPGIPSPYEFMCLMEYPSMEHLGAQMAKATPEANQSMLEDVKTFSKKEAVVWVQIKTREKIL
ncbi:hypothetical protein GGR57DRAFT_181729 [Xylariaceae sp. FL1272]|nr:hypothetical protein GGR57DRAFT_181729 [Xylariaceae sp. FL1272]